MGGGKKMALSSLLILIFGLGALVLISFFTPQSTHRDIAFGCFATCAVGFFAISSIYFFTPRFMTYHQEASGMEWDDLSPQFQSLILAVLRTVAGGFFCAALATSLLLWIPFRQGLTWSGPVIFAIYNGMALPALFGTVLVKINTPAIPPIVPLVFAVLLSFMGLILSI